MKLVGSVLGLSLVAILASCKSAPPRESVKPLTSVTVGGSYPTLAAQAKELEDALGRKDYGKVIDLTYPKVIEVAGGREKILEETTKEVQSMEADGVEIISSTCDAPRQFVSEGGNIYAVVPVTSKVKAQDGIFQTEGSLIAISSDGGKNWTFVDATGKDQTELKKVLPNLDELSLPPEKPPVKLSTK